MQGQECTATTDLQTCSHHSCLSDTWTSTAKAWDRLLIQSQCNASVRKGAGPEPKILNWTPGTTLWKETHLCAMQACTHTHSNTHTETHPHACIHMHTNTTRTHTFIHACTHYRHTHACKWMQNTYTHPNK